MRLFRIRSYGGDFYTGRIASGQLVLMGLLCPYLVVVYFDANGGYLSLEEVELTLPPQQEGATRIYWEESNGTIKEVKTAKPLVYNTRNPEFHESLEKDIRAWWKKFGFRKQAIDIQEFFIEERYLGIRLLPEYLKEFIEDPEEIAEDQEDAAEYQEILDRWRASGKFVFWWGKDYWFGKNGKVEST